jgi:hypothetical protein
MGRSVAWGLVWAAFACPVAAQEESRPGLRAGAAASNVTPFLGEPIVGNWDSPPAAHIHDELHARCLALDDGRTRLLFVVCDNVGVSREVFDEARGMIEKETGVPGAHVLLSSTHTHSATSARGRGPLGGGRFRTTDVSLRAGSPMPPAGRSTTWSPPASPGDPSRPRSISSTAAIS